MRIIDPSLESYATMTGEYDNAYNFFVYSRYLIINKEIKLNSVVKTLLFTITFQAVNSKQFKYYVGTKL